MAYAIPLNYVMIHKVIWSDPWIQAVVMTVLFTILSICLKYIMRRIFNEITARQFMHEVRQYPPRVKTEDEDGNRSVVT